MTSLPTPKILRAWLLATQSLSGPIAFVSKHLHRRMGADLDRFPERLGQSRAGTPTDVIWFHAASLGEVTQIGPLVQALAGTEHAPILVTTTTQAGADWVARELPDVQHQFVPIDTPAAVAGFLDSWLPGIAIFVEGDLWPRLVMETQGRGIPQVLLNARNSRTRARFPAAFTMLLAQFSLVTCRSETVAKDIRALGVPADRVKVFPDLRVASPKLPAPDVLTQDVSQMIGARPVWLAASTHPGDEAAVLAAHEKVIAMYPDALLVLAPRHPKRGAPLTELAQAQGFAVARRSLGETVTSATQVYVADTLGELGAFFKTIGLTFLGGSFGKEGGHNPYEPASFGSAIVSGPYVKNFADAYDALTQADAAVLVKDPAILGATLVSLLQSDRLGQMGQSGQAFMGECDDCIDTYTGQISAILAKSRQS